MKKLKLKKWVEDLLIIVQVIIIILMAGDCESTLYFVISKLILMIVFLIDHSILSKYTDLFKGELFDE